jgi:hypothetical protein
MRSGSRALLPSTLEPHAEGCCRAAKPPEGTLDGLVFENDELLLGRELLDLFSGDTEGLITVDAGGSRGCGHPTLRREKRPEQRLDEECSSTTRQRRKPVRCLAAAHATGASFGNTDPDGFSPA